MAVVRYTLLRVLILAVVGALLWLIGFRSFALFFSAVLISGFLSIFVLRRSRDQLSATLDKRMSTIKNRLEQRTAAEDAWNDAERSDGPETSDGPEEPESAQSLDAAEPRGPEQTREQGAVSSN